LSESTPTPDEADTTAGGAPDRGSAAGRKLDPLSIAALTVVSLAVALFLTWGLISVFGDDGGDTTDPVDLDTVLEDPSASPEGERSALEIGQVAPDAELEMFGGGTLEISDLRGSPAVINFWSSTCAPCLAEMPDLESVHQELGDQVQFIGVDVTDPEQAGAEMIQQTGVTYPNGRDPKAEVMGLFGGIALPRTVLLDSDGKVVEVHNGEITAEELTDSLDGNGLI